MALSKTSAWHACLYVWGFVFLASAGMALANVGLSQGAPVALVLAVTNPFLSFICSAAVCCVVELVSGDRSLVAMRSPVTVAVVGGPMALWAGAGLTLLLVSFLDLQPLCNVWVALPAMLAGLAWLTVVLLRPESAAPVVAHVMTAVHTNAAVHMSADVEMGVIPDLAAVLGGAAAAKQQEA